MLPFLQAKLFISKHTTLVENVEIFYVLLIKNRIWT